MMSSLQQKILKEGITKKKAVTKRRGKKGEKCKLRALLESNPELVLEDFVVKYRRSEHLHTTLDEMMNQILQSHRCSRIRRRDILVQENSRNTNENKLLGVVCLPVKDAESDTPEEYLIRDPQGYFAFLMALAEAGAMNREAPFAPEKQALIVKYWPGNQIIGAKNLLVNIKPLILGLASCVILENYRQNAGRPQWKTRECLKPDFESFFGRQLSVDDVRSTAEDNYKAFKELRKQQLISCGIKDSDMELYLPTSEDADRQITVFVLVNAMIVLYNEEDYAIREVWANATQAMIDKSPTDTHVENQFRIIKERRLQR
ncbi:hypothetical protein O1611_g6008 [Lasiodiplodia mahajangana]|uniref:Uncharacterized protein n=1 Tax=Lasiodiplodia mahajangana TaxID=1108764 RepID=A0ACC2JJV9_9PEZI|nr:hypothetical protein O1611_g6008 [Lasiodiplodia mahajangana]